MLTDNHTISALNSVAKALIDSQRSYEFARDMVEGKNQILYHKLIRRADERRQLVCRFQTEIRYLGGEPAEEAGPIASDARKLARFSSLFESDSKAALDAIDDGEENLAGTILNAMNDPRVDQTGRVLLETAFCQAQQGEAFSERLSAVA